MEQSDPIDGGPIYAETDFSQFIVEPWNAFSSLFILAPAIYWGIKLFGRYKEYGFLTFCLPFLFIGGLGSTLYHAFRASPYLLVMDVLPSAILTVSIAIYFWYMVFKNWIYVAILIVAVIALRFFLFSFLDQEAAVNTGYLITGATFFIPVFILLKNTGFRYYRLIIAALLSLGLSLLFREIDKNSEEYLNMGTHFLWHIFSGAGAYFIALYIYRLKSLRIALS